MGRLRLLSCSVIEYAVVLCHICMYTCLSVGGAPTARSA